MRNVNCNICRDTIKKIDLHKETTVDPMLLQAQELGQGRTEGLNHLWEKHPNETLLSIQASRPIDRFYSVTEYNPVSSALRLPHSSKVRR